MAWMSGSGVDGAEGRGRPRGCIDDRGGGQGGDLGAKRRRRAAVAVGMQPAGQDDDERLGLGIDPETGAGKAGMAEAGATEEIAAWRAVTGLHVPAQPPALARGRRRGVDHGPHGQRREDAAAVGPDSSVQERLGEDRQIVGGREQSGVAGDSSQRPGPRIMDDSAEHRACRRLALGRRDPVDGYSGRR